LNVRAHVHVSGLVQGVFFRYATQREARQWSVSGWVRNLPDGSVEAIFEGERDKVVKMIEFVKVGPLGSRVDSVEVNWEKWSGQFDGFRILR